MLTLPGYSYVVLTGVVVLVVAELLWTRATGRDSYNPNETLSNIVMLIGSRISRLILGTLAMAPLAALYAFAPVHMPDQWWAYVLAFFFVDFLYYWEHRCNHEIRLLWTLHEVHHSSPWFNFTTSFRLNWLGSLTIPIFFAPAVLLGFSPKQIIAFFAINLLYQFILHTESVRQLGILEGIINTPSAHRVHHGRNSIYIDKNYGGVLLIWDRLFHTYQPEVEPVLYGIKTGFVGYNPFKAQFGSLFALILQLKNSKLKQLQRVEVGAGAASGAGALRSGLKSQMSGAGSAAGASARRVYERLGRS